MAIAKLPEDFNPHRGIKKVFDSRQKMVESGEGIDWGFAEALAFGTLVSEGSVALLYNLLCDKACSHVCAHGRLCKGKA